MSEKFTGFRTIQAPSNIIEDLHSNKWVKIWDKRYSLYPNMYVELRDLDKVKHTAIGRVDPQGEWIRKICPGAVSGVEPRNREQSFAIDALTQDEITTVILTGPAGTGKTLLALAVAMDKVDSKTYSKVIITRPMSHVGKYSLGALPGDVEEKFSPYLLNYMTNLEFFIDRSRIDDLISQYRFEMIPLQLMRGASFRNCLVIADEMQVCDYTEILTVGSRIGENSKIVLMGDLSQRDEKIAKDKTGIYKMTHDQKAKQSPLVAAIELRKCERSPTAKLFSEVFQE